MTRSSVSLFLALPLLALTGLACGGDDINDILAPPTFDYEPQFAEYTGGVGLSNSPLAGVWQIRINASSNGTVAAQTINVVPQVINDEHGDPNRVLGFTLAPNRAANIYLEGTLGDSTLDMKLYQYEPGTNTVTTYTMEGLLDLGQGTITSGTYTVDTRIDEQTPRQASGTFQLTIEDETDEEQFPDFEDGQLTAIDFMAVSGLGQEDSVITGRITPTLDGQNATATITVTARDDHNQSLGTGTLTATGSFNPNTNVLDLTTITGAIGTIDFTGHIRLSLVNVGNTTLFPATGFASGIVLLSAEDDANGTLAGLDFGGTAGTSSQI